MSENWKFRKGVCPLYGIHFTFTEGIPEGHKWSNWASNGDDTHSRTCYVCQATEQQECSGGTAACTALAVCDICGKEYGELNASNHTNLVKIEAKPATHMTEGNIEYWHCDGCDKYFSDEAGTQKIALADTVIPKLTEHTADGTGWHSDEKGHWNTCECGEKLNEAVHSFQWVTDKEATTTEAGLRHEECKVCGYKKAAVEIPAAGTTDELSKPSKPSGTSKPGETPTPPEPQADTDIPGGGNQTGDKGNPDRGKTGSPQTGDNSNIALWIAVMLAAGAVLTGTAVYRHKRKFRR